jgi:hypothetical protein
LGRERFRQRLHRFFLRGNQARRLSYKIDIVEVARKGGRRGGIWIFFPDCLQGEVIPQPQNPTDYGFDFHCVDYGVGTKDTGAAARLQVSVEFVELDVTAMRRRCL